jgi:hypothetical protein
MPKYIMVPDDAMEGTMGRIFRDPFIKPVAKDPDVREPTEMEDTYRGLMLQLAYEPPEFVAALVLEYLAEKKIQVYDYMEVCTWLTAKRFTAGKRVWVWRPLRIWDVVKYHWMTTVLRPDGFHAAHDGFYDSRNPKCEPFVKEVPQHMHEKATLLHRRFGKRVKFFISDSEEKLDRFIMVRPAVQSYRTEVANHNIVFDLWSADDE